MTTATVVNYANALSSNGRFDEALAVLDRGVTAFPTSINLLVNRAKLHGRMGDFDSSIADAKRIYELYQKEPVGERMDDFPSSSVIGDLFYYTLATPLYNEGRYAEAAVCFEKARDIGIPEHKLPRISSSVNWAYLSHARAGNLDAAQAVLESFNFTVSDFPNPDDIDFYFNAIQLYKGLCTVESLEMVDTTKPWGPSLYYPIALHYIICGEKEKAKPYLAVLALSNQDAFFAVSNGKKDWETFFPGEKPVIRKN